MPLYEMFFFYFFHGIFNVLQTMFIVYLNAKKRLYNKNQCYKGWHCFCWFGNNAWVFWQIVYLIQGPGVCSMYIRKVPQFRPALAVKFVMTGPNWLQRHSSVMPLDLCTPRCPCLHCPVAAVALQTCFVASAYLVTQSHLQPGLSLRSKYHS